MNKKEKETRDKSTKQPFKKSMHYAIDGLVHTLFHERNFRTHILCLALVTLIGLFYQLSTYEWLAITLISTMVLMAEMFNTAIENTLDWLEPNHHEVVKIVKDICAGAVLVTAIGAIIIAILIFTPKFIHSLHLIFEF